MPEASDIDPPCPECHAARVETSGACLWCDLHARLDEKGNMRAAAYHEWPASASFTATSMPSA